MTSAHPTAPQTGRRIEATNRRVVVLAVPMMLSHVTEPLLGLVNAVVIGRLGDAALLGAAFLASDLPPQSLISLQLPAVSFQPLSPEPA